MLRTFFVANTGQRLRFISEELMNHVKKDRGHHSLIDATSIMTRSKLVSMRVTLLFCWGYGIVVLPGPSSAAPFTIVVLPDTQYYSALFPEQFRAQTTWIVANRAEENIVMVTHVGDIVENGGQGWAYNDVEWNNADAAISILDNDARDLPYGVALGNHDYDRVNTQSSAQQYVTYFGASRYSGRDWYGGSSPSQLNHYQRFSADGRNFLHITLEWRPQPSSLNWAQSVLDENPGVPTIISTHEYLSSSGARSWPSGIEVFDNLVDNNSQVFMVLSGHYPGESHQTAINSAGLEVFEMMANYQSHANGGDGWMRLIEFDGAHNRIDVRTYSPTRDQYNFGSAGQFTLNLDFNSRFGVIPEPTTLCLITAGLVGLSCGRRGRRQAPPA